MQKMIPKDKVAKHRDGVRSQERIGDDGYPEWIGYVVGVPKPGR
jgi:hypothetical protein